MNAARLFNLVSQKVGEGVALALAGTDEIFHALQEAQVQLARYTLATRIRVELPVPANRRIPLPATAINLLDVEIPVHLFQTSFQDMIERNPTWQTSTGPAECWCQITPRIIGVDGTVPGDKITVSVLEEPTPIVDATSVLDERLRSVDENVLVLLAAAVLLNNAADGQDVNRAAMLRKEAFKTLQAGRQA